MSTTDDARLLEIEAFLGACEKRVLGYSEERAESDVRYLLDRLKAAESRIRELEDEIAYLVKVGRCGGNVSGTEFDADGGFAYSNECSLPLGHTNFHADPKNEHPAEWLDWRTRLERPAIRVYEVQEDVNGVQ